MDERTAAAVAAMASARVLLGLTAEALKAAHDAVKRVPERAPENDGLWAETIEPLVPMADEMGRTARTLDSLEDVLIREAMRP